MKLVIAAIVVLVVMGLGLLAMAKELRWLSDWKKVLSPVQRLRKALWLRWDRHVARKSVRAFRRHIKRALKKGNRISVDIDREHLTELKKMSKHDLEKMCAMITATLQMYEAVYGSDLVNRIVHKWPSEQRVSGKAKK